MTTQDDEFARKITGYLDQGTAAMRAGTAYRLQLARQQAIARLASPQRAREAAHSDAMAGATAGAGTGSGTAGGGRGFWMSAKLWIGIALITAAGFGYQSYQQWQVQKQITELEDTDAALLTSDLPIDAYVDRGFQNWLKHLDE